MEQQSSAPPPARAIVDFLRSSSGPKTKVGVFNGQRRDYFKGSGAVKALRSPAYAKAQAKKGSLLPAIDNDETAEKVLHAIIPFAFFLRVDRADGAGKEKNLQINQMQMFQQELFYVWLYDGSQLLLKLSGFGMILLMLAGVMFPLWPSSMRVGVWYLSMGVLGLIGAFFGLAVIRLILWAITKVVARPGIWLFPNLFEDVGFVDSFIPLWAWDVPPPKKAKKSKKAAAAVEGAGAANGASGAQASIADSAGEAASALRARAPGGSKGEEAAGGSAQGPAQASAEVEAAAANNGAIKKPAAESKGDVYSTLD